VTARPLLLVTGIAEGLGAEIASAFARAGHDVVGLSRSKRCSANIRRSVEQHGGSYIHLACDLTQAGDVATALAHHGEGVDVLIHNAHALLIKPFDQVTAVEFEHVWRVACLGAMLSAQAVIPHMAARKTGIIIFTGASAGIRGGANFSAFASAKFALRGLVQSLAREFGPKGIHVAHLVLDGLIDEVQTDQRFGASSSARMSPQAIARACLDLAAQHPSAWTHEMDLRPFSERF
jgi:NAD(P)-dependent dehydrogenase (short-subunit alcohol dehydrogenase family)